MKEIKEKDNPSSSMKKAAVLFLYIFKGEKHVDLYYQIMRELSPHGWRYFKTVLAQASRLSCLVSVIGSRNYKSFSVGFFELEIILWPAYGLRSGGKVQ